MGHIIYLNTLKSEHPLVPQPAPPTDPQLIRVNATLEAFEPKPWSQP